MCGVLVLKKVFKKGKKKLRFEKNKRQKK